MAKKDFRDVGAVQMGDLFISPSRLFGEGVLVLDTGEGKKGVQIVDIPGFGRDKRTGPVRVLKGEEKELVRRGGSPAGATKAPAPTTPSTPTTAPDTAIKAVPKLKYSPDFGEMMRGTFPESFKDGGLVRGGGKAVKGRGRGKMV
jgi:hypothetical protein